MFVPMVQGIVFRLVDLARTYFNIFVIELSMLTMPNQSQSTVIYGCLI